VKGLKKPSRLLRSPTLEERRALLCCFILSSWFANVHLHPVHANGARSSSFLRKGETLRWTTYSNECLHILETQKECASDILLVQLVKLRLISERVTDAHGSGQVDHSIRPPAIFYLKSLEAQLQDFKSNIPHELADNSKWSIELSCTGSIICFKDSYCLDDGCSN
jgi:hypothetical protein